MGFRDTAAFKQAMQRTSTGPTGGFLSQRTCSFDQGLKANNLPVVAKPGE